MNAGWHNSEPFAHRTLDDELLCNIDLLLIRSWGNLSQSLCRCSDDAGAFRPEKLERACARVHKHRRVLLFCPNLRQSCGNGWHSKMSATDIGLVVSQNADVVIGLNCEISSLRLLCSFKANNRRCLFWLVFPILVHMR
jgi:hypothetical protein